MRRVSLAYCFGYALWQMLGWCLIMGLIYALTRIAERC